MQWLIDRFVEWRYGPILKYIAMLRDDTKETIDRGKGEWLKPGYITDEYWAQLWTRYSFADHLIRAFTRTQD